MSIIGLVLLLLVCTI